MSWAAPGSLAHTDDEFLIDWSPRKAVAAVWLTFTVACLARWALNRLVPAPYIFNDEQRYLELARSAVGPRGLYWNGSPAFFPSWGYPLLITPFTHLWPFSKCLSAIQLTNTLLINLAIPLTYCWAREVISLRRAVYAAVLVALLPSMGFSATIMTESVFMPVVVLALWLGWRHLLRPGFGRGIAAGLAAALAFHLKPQGLILPITFLMCGLVAELIRPGPRKHLRDFIFSLMPALLRHAWLPLGFMIGLLPRLAVVHWIEHPGEPFRWSFLMGLYHPVGFQEVQYASIHFFTNLGIQFATWVICCGIFPAWNLGLELIRSLRRSYAFERQILCWLVLISSAGMIVLIARHMVLMNEHWIPYERYLFVLYPPLLILYANHLPCRIQRAWRPLFVMAGIFSALLFGLLVSDKWHLVSNAPGLCLAFVLVKAWRQIPTVAGVGWILLMSAVLMLVVPWRTVKPFSAGLVLLLLSMNFGWYALHKGVLRKTTAPERDVAKKIDKKIGPGGLLYILPDRLKLSQHFTIGSWHASRFNAWHEHPLKWLEHASLAFDSQGQWRVPETSADPWLFVSEHFQLAGKKGTAMKFGILYDLNPGETVQLVERNMPANLPKPSANQKPTLQLTVVNVPEFHAAQTAFMRVKIQNTGNKTIPQGNQKIFIGYHWSDPQRTGSWSAIIWDDGRATPLPRLRPAESAVITLAIQAPQPPSATWMLQLAPRYDDEHGRHFLTFDQALAETAFQIEVKR